MGFDGEEGNLRGDFRSPFDRDVALELHSKKTRRKTIGWGLGMGMDNCACVGKASMDHGEVGSVRRCLRVCVGVGMVSGYWQ